MRNTVTGSGGFSGRSRLCNMKDMQCGALSEICVFYRFWVVFFMFVCFLWSVFGASAVVCLHCTLQRSLVNQSVWALLLSLSLDFLLMDF